MASGRDIMHKSKQRTDFFAAKRPFHTQTNGGQFMDYRELNIVRELKYEYDRMIQRLADLRVFAQPTTPLLDGMPHTPAQTPKIETLATLIVDTEKSTLELATRIEQEKANLLIKLQSFNMRELSQRVLSYYYACCQSFAAIAKLIHYSRSHIIFLHDEGLRAIGLDAHEMIAYKKTLRNVFPRH